MGHKTHLWLAGMLKICGHSLLFPQTVYIQPQCTLGTSYLLICIVLKTTYVYYLVVSMDQGSGHGSTRFCTWGLSKSCSQRVARTEVISRLNQRRIHFQAHVVVGRVRFTSLSCGPLMHGSLLHPSVQTEKQWRGPTPQQKSHFSNLITKWYPITFAVFCWLGASHLVQPALKG